MSHHASDSIWRIYSTYALSEFDTDDVFFVASDQYASLCDRVRTVGVSWCSAAGVALVLAVFDVGIDHDFTVLVKCLKLSYEFIDSHNDTFFH